LEVYELTGCPMSTLVREGIGKAALPYRLVKLVRAPEDRGVLHRRIEERFRRMLEEGLEDEVRRLWGRGDLTSDLPSMRSVGYRQMLKYLFGEYNFEEMRHRGTIATRQLAKRQYTWLRTEADCQWLLDGERPLQKALSTVMSSGL